MSQCEIDLFIALEKCRQVLQIQFWIMLILLMQYLLMFNFSNNTSLIKANLIAVKLYHSHFISTNLSNVIFIQTHVEHSTFILCNMSEIHTVLVSVLYNVYIERFYIESTNLTLGILQKCYYYSNSVFKSYIK